MNIYRPSFKVNLHLLPLTLVIFLVTMSMIIIIHLFACNITSVFLLLRTCFIDELQIYKVTVELVIFTTVL